MTPSTVSSWSWLSFQEVAVAYGSEFLAGVVDYHFIRLIYVQLKVISAGPLGDVVQFIGDK